MPDPSQTLPIARHERFVQGIAGGLPAAEAYSRAGYIGKGAGPASEKLLEEREISERLAFLKANPDAKSKAKPKSKAEPLPPCKLTREKVIEILTRVILARPSENDAENPLCEMRMGKDGEYYLFPDKIACIRLLGAWNGWEKDTAAENPMGDGLIDKIRNLTHGTR